MSQLETTEPVPALDEAGRPVNFGWARSPLFTYEHGLLMSPRRSISESDRYVISSPTHLILFEILDDGYLGYMCISVASLKDRKRSTHTFLTPFSLGSFNLPRSSESGSIKFYHKKSYLNFAVMDKGIRIIKVDAPKFSRTRTLRGEVVLTPPPEAESLVTHLPWREKENAFCYTRRSPWYTVEGVIQLGTTELIFTRNNAWGIYDWNRRVRPRKDLRFWASGCGQSDGRQVGFSVGHSSADSSYATENAFFLDGKLHKLDQVTFHIPSNRPVPWRFTSNDNRLEMTFSPQQERDENHQMLFYSLKRRQLFGSFSGAAKLDDGSRVEFSDITGFAERRKSRL
ncbi:MAG: DUF2804 domain-containing protein [Treponema sp.]|nr:DUF2804 domain-containing protein [Treponema sp.]